MIEYNLELVKELVGIKSLLILRQLGSSKGEGFALWKQWCILRLEQLYYIDSMKSFQQLWKECSMSKFLLVYTSSSCNRLAGDTTYGIL